MRKWCIVLLVLLLVTGVASAQLPGAIRVQPPRITIPSSPILIQEIQLPELHRWIANDLLISFNTLPGFDRATIAGVYPIYGVGGKTVGNPQEAALFYEVKFRARDGKDAGYAILSATEDDLPVVEFSHQGLTHFERFQKEVKGSFTMRRYGSGYITAENPKGELLSEIGLRPEAIPEEIRRTYAHLEEEAQLQSIDATPRLNLIAPIKIPQLDQAQLRAVDYGIWKDRIVPSNFIQAERSEIKDAWSEVQTRFRQHSQLTSPNVAYASSQCRFEYTWAAGRNNHPYFLQLSANTSPNNRNHASGCGPTAWMNIYGWHNLHWRTNLLTGSPTTNNANINNLTMQLVNHLGTSGIWGQGFTYPSDMGRGISFATNTLGFRASYWWRWSLSPRSSKKTWIFQVARDMARNQRPFIVGYFSDWHYAIGLGIAECRNNSWIYIYPAWRTNNTQNKWIPKSTIFGVWGVYNFYR